LTKYRKNLVVIEAVQLTKDNWKDIFDFINSPDSNMCKYNLTPNGELKIKTEKNDIVVHKGDWIIKDVMGEFYSCKPDIFEKTYELVED